jgi:chromosome segregation ATPase
VAEQQRMVQEQQARLAVEQQQQMQKGQQQVALTEAEIQAKHDRLRALRLLHDQQHVQKLSALQEQQAQLQHTSAQLQEKSDALSMQEKSVQEREQALHKAQAAAVTGLNAQVLQLQETLSTRDSKLLLVQQLLQEEQQKVRTSRDEIRVLQGQLAAAEGRCAELQADLMRHGSLSARTERLRGAEADVEEQRALLRANLDLLEEREHQLRVRQAAAAAAAENLSKLRPGVREGVHHQQKEQQREHRVGAAADKVCCEAESVGLNGLMGGVGHRIVRLTVHVKPSAE